MMLVTLLVLQVKKSLVSAAVGAAKNANNYRHQRADVRLFASILSMIRRNQNEHRTLKLT